MTASVVVPSLFAVYLALGMALARRACRRAEGTRAWRWWEDK